LPGGFGMETLRCRPVGSAVVSRDPPLVFLHGSFHAAWCWAEHWMPYFSAVGRDCYAVSLRGTQGSPLPEDGTSVSMDDHISDLGSWLEMQLPGQAPVLVAHSFGGILAMKLLEEDPRRFSGAALFCSVPPSGNGPMTLRFLGSRPMASVDIVRGFVAKQAATRPILCRRLFFGSSLPEDSLLHRYMQCFQADSRVTLDLRALAPILPSKSADDAGVATFAHRLPPILVAGAGEDFLVDREGVTETGRFLGVAPSKGLDSLRNGDAFIFLESLSHDVMLGSSWLVAAKELERWLLL